MSEYQDLKKSQLLSLAVLFDSKALSYSFTYQMHRAKLKRHLTYVFSYLRWISHKGIPNYIRQWRQYLLLHYYFSDPGNKKL